MNNKITPTLDYLSTIITVKDANESLKFYVDVFGFKVHEATNDREGNVIFAKLIYQNISLIIMPSDNVEIENAMIAPILSKTSSQIGFYMYCTNFNETYNQLKSYGLEFLNDREIKFWGDKLFRVLDINGYIWNFATKFTEHDATKVPVEML